MSERGAHGGPESSEFLRQLLRRLPAFVWATDAALRVSFVDGGVLDAISARAIFGSTPEEVSRLFRPLLDGEPIMCEIEFGGRWYYVHAEPHMDAGGKFLGSTGVGIDVTLRRSEEQRLLEESAALNEAQQLADVGSFVVHIPTRMVMLSPQMYRTLGTRNPGKAVPFSEILRHVHPADRRSFALAQHNYLGGDSPFQIDHRIVREDGEIRHVRYRAHIQRDAQGNAVRCVGTMQDITQLVESQIESARLAHHDALTGLPNRTLLRDRLAQAVALAHREGHTCCVAFMDLDNFKNVNDSLGHSEGDVLLGQVAQRLRGVLRETDTLARVGGDEFVLVLNDSDAAGAQSAMEKIRTAMDSPFVLSDGTHALTASVGLAMYPDDAGSSEELLRYADAAMYEAKQMGRNQMRRYRRELGTLPIRRTRIHADLRKALEQSQLQVLYQPVIAAKTLTPIGVEALVRWRHPEFGLLQPAQFIPLTEESDLSEQIGEWVLRTALDQIAQWRRRYGIQVRLGINLSARQLRRGGHFAQTLASALSDSNLPAGAVDVEVTESTLMQDLQSSAAVLGEVRDQGAGVAIDDFGTGRNSLGYLKQIPATGLKIDRSFVTEMDKHLFDQAISYSLAALGKTLGLRVVAEGVETLSQFRSLLLAGCDELQGYFFSPAMAPEDFVQKYVPFAAEGR